MVLSIMRSEEVSFGTVDEAGEGAYCLPRPMDTRRGTWLGARGQEYAQSVGRTCKPCSALHVSHSHLKQLVADETRVDHSPLKLAPMHLSLAEHRGSRRLEAHEDPLLDVLPIKQHRITHPTQYHPQPSPARPASLPSP